MRIAIHHNLPSGGAKRALYEWVLRLQTRHTLDLFRYPTTDESYLDIRPLVHSVSEFGRGLPVSTGSNFILKGVLYRRLVEASKAMASAIDRKGYDVVFVHHCTYVQSPMLLRYLRTPSVYMCQEPFRRVREASHSTEQQTLSQQLRGRVQNGVDRILKGLDETNAWAADVVLANSHFSRESILRAYGIVARTNYLGVSEHNFKPDGRKKSDFVLSVGRLAPHKGHEFVIASLALIPPAVRPPLVISFDQGSHEERARLQQLAARADVRLTLRETPADQMPELYNRALLTVYSPHLEPLGLVPLESMACATPVVGIHEGGIRETVRHGETGLLTERDPADFAEAVADLLASPSKRRDFGENGRRWVEANWTWDISTERLAKNLRRAIDLGGASGHGA